VQLDKWRSPYQKAPGISSWKKEKDIAFAQLIV
jgi:hypothetical protein